MPDNVSRSTESPVQPQDSLSFANAGEREEFWRAAIQEHTGSGLSVRAFCIAQGLPIHSFHHWKRTFQKREEAGEKAANPQEPAPTLRFAEVNLSAALPHPASGCIEIQYGDFLLRLPAGCDRDLLRDVLSLLGEMPC